MDRETLIEYLEKRVYVFRRSYNDYQRYVTILTILKFASSASGLGGFIYFPLTALSALSAFIEVFDKSILTAEKKESYFISYKFYKELLNLIQNNSCTVEEILKKENEFIKSTNYLPKEIYLKKMKMNGYKFSL